MKTKKRVTVSDLIKEKQQEENLKRKFNINEDNDKTIIIENKNLFVQFFNLFGNCILRIIKFLFISIISILSTIGLTVLINEPLRTLFLKLISDTIF